MRFSRPCLQRREYSISEANNERPTDELTPFVIEQKRLLYAPIPARWAI